MAFTTSSECDKATVNNLDAAPFNIGRYQSHSQNGRNQGKYHRLCKKLKRIR